MNLALLDPAHYAAQLDEKRLKLKQIFASFNTPELEVFESAPSHYRMRSEFRVWHEGEDMYFYMDETRPNQSLRHEFFQLELLSTSTGEI